MNMYNNINGGTGDDTINAFEDNTDKIDLSNYTKSNNEKIKFSDLSFNETNSDVVITGFNSGDQLNIDNILQNKINC